MAKKIRKAKQPKFGGMFMPEYYGDDVGFATSEDSARGLTKDKTGVNEDRPNLGRIEKYRLKDVEREG